MTEDGVTDDLVDNNGVVAEEEVKEEMTDGEFPGVGGNDGNGSDDETTEGEDGSGNDDGSCIDGRGSEEDDETTGVSGCVNDNGNGNFNVLHVRSRQHTD